MSGPFPGMDPFLESLAYWRDFHQSFITYWRDRLLDHLPDHYEVRIDERLCVVDEAYLKVLHRPDASLIAVLELLSPTNKSGEGRRDYLIKRQDLFQEPVHLVELDLLLGGIRLPMKQKLPSGNYYAFVSRGDRRPNCEVYHWRLCEPLPRIRLQGKAPDPDVVFDLPGLFAHAYQRGRYFRNLPYAAAPPVTLTKENAKWVTQRLAQWQKPTTVTDKKA